MNLHIFLEIANGHRLRHLAKTDDVYHKIVSPHEKYNKTDHLLEHCLQ